MKLLKLLLLLLAVPAAAAPGDPGSAKRRRALPNEYGRVVIANHSDAARLPPVVFDHWLHRAKFTCRLCHVDIGFGMKAGASDIRAADNMAGQFCGACHNGRTRSPDGKKLFESCAKTLPGDASTCFRCHSQGKDVKPENDFATFTKGFPRERFGNGIDWEKAEQQKVIQLSDYLEGVSIKRAPLSIQKDFALAAKLEGMPDILFSHAKHTVWNGCELCHPQIFAVRRGTTKASMVQIFEGQFCGACHVSVAFPLTDCQRCHTVPVR